MKHILLIVILLCTANVNGQLAKNKIYFTNNPNSLPSKMTQSDVQSSFNQGEDVYAVIITDGLMKNALPHNQPYFWVSSSSIPELASIRFKTPSKYCNPMQNYMVFPVILQNDEDDYVADDANAVMKQLNNLPTGKHTIKILLKEGGVAKYAGSFTLNTTKEQNALSEAKQINPNSREKGYLQFGMKNSDVENAILKLFKEKYPTIHFDRVIINSDNFKLVRNSSGKVKQRTINADILTSSAGKCKAYFVTVKQRKFGQSYGTYEFEKVNGYYPINCDDI